MTVPDFQQFMRPLLMYASDGLEKNINDAIEAIADQFKLSDDDRNQLVSSKNQTLLSNRIHWAKTYLDKACTIERTRRSHFRITERGQNLLRTNPEKIDTKTLDQFKEFIEFREKNNRTTNQEIIIEKPNQKNNISNISSSTPDENIIEASNLLNQKLKGDILERIISLSPTFFEQLVVDLIVSMGYGGSRNAVAQRTQRSGDGGIDGIVNEDPLGLDVIYIQAKRYSKDNSVGSPALQQFIGALAGKGANKGVFITTSTFSSQAIQFIEKIPQKVVLIDGNNLTDLMIQYDVGVRVESTIKIKKIDIDYFEEIED